MKTQPRIHIATSLLVAVLGLALAPSAFACGTCGKSAKPATVAATAGDHSASDKPQKHPLKGVIVEVLASQDALVVKHEEIPGVMKAMTMMFTVDPAVLKAVKKGDAITAQMSHRDGDWRLDDVKVIVAPGA